MFRVSFTLGGFFFVLSGSLLLAIPGESSVQGSETVYKVLAFLVSFIGL